MAEPLCFLFWFCIFLYVLFFPGKAAGSKRQKTKSSWCATLLHESRRRYEDTHCVVGSFYWGRDSRPCPIGDHMFALRSLYATAQNPAVALSVFSERAKGPNRCGGMNCFALTAVAILPRHMEAEECSLNHLCLLLNVYAYKAGCFLTQEFRRHVAPCLGCAYNLPTHLRGALWGGGPGWGQGAIVPPKQLG